MGLLHEERILSKDNTYERAIMSTQRKEMGVTQLMFRVILQGVCGHAYVYPPIR